VAGFVVASILGVAIFSVLNNLQPRGATAHRFDADPAVTIHIKKRKFYGRIKSGFGKCKRNRRVSLIRARPGISDLIVARTRTGSQGRWRVERRRRPRGRFYARIYRKHKRSYGHSHRCRRDRSRTIRVRRRR
jgi:hypothetical protein